jgi:hypothetical protein
VNIIVNTTFSKPLDIMASFTPRNRDEEWAKSVVLRHRAKMTTRAMNEMVRRAFYDAQFRGVL